MSYEQYKGWIRAMKDSELNAEIETLNKKVRDARLRKRDGVANAWGIMLSYAIWEQRRRDDDHGHLLRGVDAQ